MLKPAAIATLLAFGATQVMAQNSTELEQTGTGNVAVLQQIGLVQSSDIAVSQVGDFNDASVTQVGESHFNVANLQQTGNLNVASLEQTWRANTLTASSTGDGNQLSGSQTGFAVAEITQRGDNNSLSFSQQTYYEGSRLSVSQDGVSNQAEIAG